MKEINQIDEAVMFLDYLSFNMTLDELNDVLGLEEDSLKMVYNALGIDIWKELNQDQKQKVFEWYLKTVK